MNLSECLYSDPLTVSNALEIDEPNSDEVRAILTNLCRRMATMQNTISHQQAQISILSDMVEKNN